MENRFRVEMYDEVKSNDLTIYSEQGDTLKKKKTTGAFVPMEITQSIKKQIGLPTAVLLDSI